MEFINFRRSLKETRRYRDPIDDCLSLKEKNPSMFKNWRISPAPASEIDSIVEGTHIMKPGNPTGLEAVNKKFNVILPNDLDQFYKNWDGGYLLLSVPYTLLSVDEIIERNIWIRSVRHEPLDAPWKIVKFAHISDGNYIGMSRIGAEWYILFISNEYYDAELSQTGKPPRQGLPATFSEWLDLILKTDGVLPDIWPSTFERLP